MDQFVVHELQNVLCLDGLKSSHPISLKVNNPNEINDIFDRISYAKGDNYAIFFKVRKIIKNF